MQDKSLFRQIPVSFESKEAEIKDVMKHLVS